MKNKNVYKCECNVEDCDTLISTEEYLLLRSLRQEKNQYITLKEHTKPTSKIFHETEHLYLRGEE